MMLECPECGYPMYCDCERCEKKIPPGFMPKLSYEESFDIAIADYPGKAMAANVIVEMNVCPLCFYRNSVDWWLDYEVGQLKRAGEWPKGGITNEK